LLQKGEINEVSPFEIVILGQTGTTVQLSLCPDLRDATAHGRQGSNAYINNILGEDQAHAIGSEVKDPSKSGLFVNI
jgi:hypothetical protein